MHSCLCFVQVKFTGYKDRPFEERKKKFIDDVTQGHSVIVSHILTSQVMLYNYTLYIPPPPRHLLSREQTLTSNSVSTPSAMTGPLT